MSCHYYYDITCITFLPQVLFGGWTAILSSWWHMGTGPQTFLSAVFFFSVQKTAHITHGPSAVDRIDTPRPASLMTYEFAHFCSRCHDNSTWWYVRITLVVLPGSALTETTRIWVVWHGDIVKVKKMLWPDPVIRFSSSVDTAEP